jgi:DNA-binding cell septation regulator SpoVG
LKVEKFLPGEWGKVVAFFDVRTKDGFLIKGFKLITTDKGTFVGFPSQRAGAEWKQTVYGTKKSKERLLTLALAAQAKHRENADNGAPAAAWQQPIDDDIKFGQEY